MSIYSLESTYLRRDGNIKFEDGTEFIGTDGLSIYLFFTLCNL